MCQIPNLPGLDFTPEYPTSPNESRTSRSRGASKLWYRTTPIPSTKNCPHKSFSHLSHHSPLFSLTPLWIRSHFAEWKRREISETRGTLRVWDNEIIWRWEATKKWKKSKCPLSNLSPLSVTHLRVVLTTVFILINNTLLIEYSACLTKR